MHQHQIYLENPIEVMDIVTLFNPSERDCMKVAEVWSVIADSKDNGAVIKRYCDDSGVDKPTLKKLKF